MGSGGVGGSRAKSQGQEPPGRGSSPLRVSSGAGLAVKEHAWAVLSHRVGGGPVAGSGRQRHG